MRFQRYFVSFVLIVALAVACSTAPDEPDEISDELAEQPDDSAEAPEVEPNVPPYRDLVFSDTEPEVVELGSTEEVAALRVGNLNILHMPTPANEVVAVRLYLRGGSANLDETNAGIDRLALSVATNGGTESTPKDEFNARLDAMGSSVNFLSDRDFSGYAMRSVREYFDDTWDLFEEAIFEPAFDDSEVELRRDRQIANIASIVDNPDRLVSEVARDLAFANHPYIHRQLGTEANVSRFTTDQVRAWQRDMLSPERMLLVVVGNIDRDHLVERVKQGLGRLGPTGAEVPETPSVSHDRPALRVEVADLPTNYILGYYSTPTLGHPDYAALVLATQHLRDRLFEEVRTKRNLTYAVSSGVGSRAANVGFLYVTAVDPEATIPVILSEVQQLQEVPIAPDVLEKVRNVYLTRHYTDLETNASIAGQLGRAAIVGGDWQIPGQFLEEILAVTPEDIQRVAQTYMKNYQFGVVGDPQAVPPELFGVEPDGAETVDEVDDPEAPTDEAVPTAEAM